MALSPSYATTYATAATDEDILKKRQDLASRLIAAKGQGKSMEDAVLSETGVNLGNIQKGSIDTKMGTGLAEEEIAGFAERLFQPKQSTSTTVGVQQPQDSKKVAGGTFSRLDEYEKLQSQPFGAWTAEKNRTRSLESESGKMMRIARKLQRQGFGSAAERMALAGAEAKMGEPSIRTEEYRRKEAEIANLAKQEQARSDEQAKKILEMQNRMIDLTNKKLEAGEIPSWMLGMKS